MTSKRAAEQPFNRTYTLSEAQSLASFEIVLPSYVPSETSAEPEIFYAAEGATPEGLRVVFSPENSNAGEEQGLRITILEAPGDFSLPQTYRAEVVQIGGVPVELAMDPADEDEARIMTAWKASGTGFGVEFFWLSGGSAEGIITADMRKDMIRVIESMIE